MLSESLIKQIHQCDTLFTAIDTTKDCQLSMAEFKAYVKKRNPDEADHEEVLNKFKKMDLSGDGFIQFLEFLRAVCKENGVWMPKDLTIYDKLQIYELMEFRHITKKEKE